MYFITQIFSVCVYTQNPPANAGDMGLILHLGRSWEREMATHFSILAWKIPWTEEPGSI